MSILVYNHLDVEEGGLVDLLCFLPGDLRLLCVPFCATGFVCVLNLLFINCLLPSYGSL